MFQLLVKPEYALLFRKRGKLLKLGNDELTKLLRRIRVQD